MGKDIKDRKHGCEFIACTKDIIQDPHFQCLKIFRHHGKKRFDHSMSVAYNSFVIAKKLNLDCIAVARGALLHDFYFDELQEEESRKKLKKLKEMNTYRHPEIASLNAQLHFNISPLEVDIIEKHMFPLTPKRPSYKESWIVNSVDTTIAIKELFQSLVKHPYWSLTGKLNKKLEQQGGI